MHHWRCLSLLSRFPNGWEWAPSAVFLCSRPTRSRQQAPDKHTDGRNRLLSEHACGCKGSAVGGREDTGCTPAVHPGSRLPRPRGGGLLSGLRSGLLWSGPVLAVGGPGVMHPDDTAPLLADDL